LRYIAAILATSLAAQLVFAQPRATFSTTTNIVIVNVTVLDRNGRPIQNLGKDDFRLYEDGKLQTLKSVDFQHLKNDVLPPPKEPQLVLEPRSYNPNTKKAATTARLTKYQDRRLMVLLFDFSSMEPPEQLRAEDAAIKFLNSQMTSSDSVSIMTFGTELQTVLDFTSDRDLLIKAIRRFHVGESSENAATADEGADAQDQSGQFVADETEFNIFNADLKLAALEDAARKLAQYPEKKALVYISSGIQKNGVDNQSQLDATVNTAVRANVAFYPIDARGLSALIPGGDATQEGAAGNGLYSGTGQNSVKQNFNNQQETLASLAIDTGGKALLDSNDLTEAMRQVQSDFTSYYVLSYASSNPAQDGRYRRIQVKLVPRLSGLRAKLDYRQGYYAPTTFRRMSGEDKDAQLQQALLAENPITDLPMAIEVDYFRLDKGKYFTPISVKIPGSALSFRNKGSKAATELDFVANVLDARQRQVATVRDTIPLKVSETTAGEVVRKSIQYDTGVTLAPGRYTLRFVARENGAGKTGTFQTRFTIPDLDAQKRLRVSSLILSNQREAVAQQVAGVKNAKKVIAGDPLVENGQKLMPNVTRVFRPGQNVMVYLEVYDPTLPEELPQQFRRPDVEANLALYRGGKKVFDTPETRVSRLDAKRTGTLPVWLQFPVASLAPGEYECQVDLIDEFGHKFAFPRRPLAIQPVQTAAAKPK
jgi:VWFA-related protein